MISQIILLHQLVQKTAVRYIDAGITYTDIHQQSASANVSLDRSNPAVSIPSSPPFSGLSIRGEWEISVALKDDTGTALPSLAPLQDIFLFVEYEYQRSGVRHSESFEANPLTAVEDRPYNSHGA